MKKNAMTISHSNRMTAWLAAVVRFTRLGGFLVQLDVNRAHLRLGRFETVKAFQTEEWRGWSCFDLFCRFVPSIAEELFWKEKQVCISELGEARTSRLMSETPVKASLDEKGRLWLPMDLAAQIGIAMGGSVHIMGRAGAIEIWNAETWNIVHKLTREAILKILPEGLPFIEGAAKSIQLYPIATVQSRRGK